MIRTAELRRPTAGVRKNAQWLMLGNAIYAGGYWLQFMLLARSGGPGAVGLYAYALALATPAASLANLQLRSLLASDSTGAYTFREYLALRAAAITIAMLAVVLLGLATNGMPGFVAVLVPVCLMRTAEALNDIYYGAWQFRESMAVVGLSQAINGVSSAALMAAALVLHTGVAGAAIGAALGSGIALVFVYGCTLANGRLLPAGARDARVAWRRVVRLAAQAAPLGVIAFLGTVQSNIPRYFIRGSASEVALGLFAAAYQLPAAGGIVVTALSSAAVPRLASMRASGDIRGFYALTRRLLLLAALLGAAGVALSTLAGRQILSFLYDPSFAAADRMLVVLSTAMGIWFLAAVYGYALTSARIIRIQPVILGFSILVLAAGCAALVPRIGAIGAAWAIAASSALQAVASGAALRAVRAPVKQRHAARESLFRRRPRTPLR